MRKETLDNQSIPQAMGQDQNGMLNQSEQNASLNAPVTVAEPGQIMTFNGAWFSVEYPANFQARGSMRSSGDPNSFESATFTSPDNTVQFYVFSPQWRAEAIDIAVSPGESMGSVKTENNTDGQVKWWTITSNDGSYSRSYMEKINSTQNTNLIFGIRYTSPSALESNRKLYEAFKASLKQYADGADDSESGSSNGSIAYIVDPPSNVRSCPNTSCDVVAECKTKNEIVKIISLEGNWALIETNSGARGYLHSSQYAQQTAGKVFTATVDKLRFRETPSFNGAVIREVSMGTTFTYLNEQTNMLETAKIAGQELPGYWYRVRAADGKVGWIHGCCFAGL
jgi:SH3-like domain-containing protein